MPNSFSFFPPPGKLLEQIPLPSRERQFIEQSRHEIRQILNNKDPRLLLIVGPCSIHDVKGAVEYALRLKELSNEVSTSFCLVMRAYVEKPRTVLGWKGLIHDPYLDNTHQIERGYEISREFLLSLAKMGVAAACEFLDPPLAIYAGDLISWGCVGARTSSSQVHRQIASDLPMPVAFKNSTDGNIEIAVNGCLAASHGHSFLHLNAEGALAVRKSQGNPDTHVVLRGGAGKPNYDPATISASLDLLKQANLPPRIIVDCSHDNCEKKHELQPVAFQSVLHQFLEGNQNIRGLMLESYLLEGNQSLKGSAEGLQFGISITDPCLSWETTSTLIRWAHKKMQKLAPKVYTYSGKPK